MMQNKIVPSILSVVLLISNVSCAAKKSDQEDRMSTAGIVASVGAAVVGVGALIWAFSEDEPEVVLTKSQAMHDDLGRKYQGPMDMFYAPRSVDEAMLHRCILASTQAQCSSLYSDISKLADALTATEKAIKRAKSEYLKEELRRTANNLAILKRSLTNVQEGLDLHKAYFELFELQAKLSTAHARELEAIKRPARLLLGASHADINACLNLRYSSYDAEWKYPFLAYGKKCAQDIRELERAIARASSSYYTLLNNSRNLLQNLKSIHSCVVNAPEYQSNIRDRERDRLERERLELEQARLRAEQERARAERERARAEQDRLTLEHARLHAEQVHARAERERAELEYARLRQERLNSMSHMDHARHYCSICMHEWYAIADRCNCHCCC